MSLATVERPRCSDDVNSQKGACCRWKDTRAAKPNFTRVFFCNMHLCCVYGPSRASGTLRALHTGWSTIVVSDARYAQSPCTAKGLRWRSHPGGSCDQKCRRQSDGHERSTPARKIDVACMRPPSRGSCAAILEHHVAAYCLLSMETSREQASS